MNVDIERLAIDMLQAWDRAECIALPSAQEGGLSTAEAYAVGERLRPAAGEDRWRDDRYGSEDPETT